MNENVMVKYPVLPLRDLVMFPDMVVPLFVGRQRSIKALESAGDVHEILLVAQKDAANDFPKLNEIYRVGIVSKILQMSKVQESTMKVFVQGIRRVKIKQFSTENEVIIATAFDFPDEDVSEDNDLIALRRSVQEQFEEYVKANKRINPDIVNGISQTPSLVDFCNSINSHLILPVQKKQSLLEIASIPKRLEKTLLLLNSEVEMLKAETRVKNRVRGQIEKNQKDYYLNEQLKAIHKELGEEDYKEELNEMEKKIKSSKMPANVKKRGLSELKKLKAMNPMSSEAAVIRNYLEWLLEVPWKIISPTKKDLKEAQEILDNDHYGLEKIKERIIEYLAVNLRTNELRGPIICLLGPPGVGKTSLAKSIAKATGRKFVKVSLGGLRDEAEIKGHRRTYIGAMPGKIIQAMKKAGTSNPVMLLDEIDKLSSDHYHRGGDPASALLDVLDPEQNKAFDDNYLGVDYDLSKVMFIATANTKSLPRPLLDRLEIIKLSGYTEDDKMHIAKEHLIIRQAKEHSIKDQEVVVKDKAIQDIIRYYTRESGVRQLERDIATIMRKSVKRIMVNKEKNIIVDDKNLKDFLGIQKFSFGAVNKKSRIGITNGLAYTDFGGDLLEIEAVVMYGKGEVKITGKLGDVMKESVQAALSFVRFNAVTFGINPDIFKSRDIHIHVPEGATPKDGPSAGVGMCISIASALTGIQIRRDIAVTGEVTLSGRVLAIGGLKEKLMAAARGGVKEVIIPKENVKDLEEIPDNIKKLVKIIPVEHAVEALEVALEKKMKPIKWTPKECSDNTSECEIGNTH